MAGEVQSSIKVDFTSNIVDKSQQGRGGVARVDRDLKRAAFSDLARRDREEIGRAAAAELARTQQFEARAQQRNDSRLLGWSKSRTKAAFGSTMFGVGEAAATSAFGASTGMASSFGRIVQAGGSAAAFGGPALAAIATLQATVAELQTIVDGQNEHFRQLHRDIQELRKQTLKEANAAAERANETIKETEESIDRRRRLEAIDADRKRYREDRFRAATKN